MNEGRIYFTIRKSKHEILFVHEIFSKQVINIAWGMKGYKCPK